MWQTNWIIIWWVTGLALFEGPLILGAQDKLPLLPPRSCRQHWFLSTNTYRRDAIRQCFSSSDCCLPFLHWAASWQYTAQLNRVVLLYKRKKPSRADIDVDCTPSNLVNCRSITTVINNNTSKYKPNMKVSMWDIITSCTQHAIVWQQMGCGMVQPSTIILCIALLVGLKFISCRTKIPHPVYVQQIIRCIGYLSWKLLWQTSPSPSVVDRVSSQNSPRWRYCWDLGTYIIIPLITWAYIVCVCVCVCVCLCVRVCVSVCVCVCVMCVVYACMCAWVYVHLCVCAHVQV